MMWYRHTDCGGEIDIKKRRCKKCGKKWNIFSFVFDTKGVRPVVDTSPPAERISKRTPTPAPRWADRFPGLTWFVGLLPNWPRWARVVVSLIPLVLIALLIVFWIIL